MRSILILLFIVIFPSLSLLQAQTSAKKDAQKMLKGFGIIVGSYVDEVDSETLTEDAIKGMLKGLDPHSKYLTAEEVERANESLKGKFVGIGVEYRLVQDTAIVLRVIEDSPAEEYGLLSGDKIIYINDTLVAGVNGKVINRMIRGKKGTTVKLSVLRKSHHAKNVLPLIITRGSVPVKSLASAFMVDDKNGYIKLTRFSRTTYDEFMEAEKMLKKQGMKNLIVDLRNNLGGYLVSGVNISEEFLQKGDLIVYLEGRRQPRRNYKSSKKGDLEGKNVVVLINENSASSSEILAGALQDHDKAVIVGRQSYGKGLVQVPRPLPDGSQIRITTARYYTPSGRNIQRDYSKGNKEYVSDLKKRIAEGSSHILSDSLLLPDSLRYSTLNKGRTVYGGGGILPDILVPVDTTYFNQYVRTLLAQQGRGHSPLIAYLIDNAEYLKHKYKSAEAFNQDFSFPDSFFEDILSKAQGKNPNRVVDIKAFNESKDVISTSMKAQIAYFLWGPDARTRILSVYDKNIAVAQQVLNGEIPNPLD